nr:hypothetical protein [Streptomyces clavuligerus]
MVDRPPGPLPSFRPLSPAALPHRCPAKSTALSASTASTAFSAFSASSAAAPGGRGESTGADAGDVVARAYW